MGEGVGRWLEEKGWAGRCKGARVKTGRLCKHHIRRFQPSKGGHLNRPGPQPGEREQPKHEGRGMTRGP